SSFWAFAVSLGRWPGRFRIAMACPYARRPRRGARLTRNLRGMARRLFPPPNAFFANLIGRRSGDAKILRLDALFSQIEAFGYQPAFQKLTDSRRPARHMAGKAPLIEGFQFCLGKHDLQPFAARHVWHCQVPGPSFLLINSRITPMHLGT